MDMREFYNYIYNEDKSIKNLYSISGLKENANQSDIERLENVILNNDGRYEIPNSLEILKALSILKDEMCRQIYDSLFSTSKKQYGLTNYSKKETASSGQNYKKTCTDYKQDSSYSCDNWTELQSKLIEEEKSRVDAIFMKISKIYEKLKREGITDKSSEQQYSFFGNRNSDNSDFLIRRFHLYGGREWREIFNLTENREQIDVLKIDDYYVYIIDEYFDKTIIISKDLFLNFNKKTNIYGNHLLASCAVSVIRNNLRGIIWNFYNINSTDINKNGDQCITFSLNYSDYSYREVNDNYWNTYGNGTFADLNDTTREEPMLLARFDFNENHIALPRMLWEKEEFKYSEKRIGTRIFTGYDTFTNVLSGNVRPYLKDRYYNSKISELEEYLRYGRKTRSGQKRDDLESMLDGNIEGALDQESLSLARKMYLDLQQHDPKNADKVISLAFPRYIDQIKIDSYQKTKGSLVTNKRY